MTGYPLDRLYEEIAFLSYYLHWDLSTLLALEHRDRQAWVEQVSAIHRKMEDGEETRSIETFL
ncbi:MAG: hypothetical protein F9K24_20400 [Leptonema illini]|jgi:hypothetical protein|uniref:DUF6760 domain-containing protein n=1 Tax=Leptonema illini TaxID=183 RepID=A0A833LWH1_9LEPT|nr:MAG: hypothetical protein F9K24_20400 [Leptonema illini]